MNNLLFITCDPFWELTAVPLSVISEEQLSAYLGPESKFCRGRITNYNGFIQTIGQA